MIKKLTFIASLLTFSFNVSAGCVGTAAYQSCYDSSSGNSYSISRLGNTTNMNGYNSRTGSNWSQRSSTFGNNTYHSGRAANGNSWHGTQSRIGNTSIYSGVNSRGQSFYGTDFNY